MNPYAVHYVTVPLKLSLRLREELREVHCRGKKYDSGKPCLYIWGKNGNPLQTNKNNKLSFNEASEGFEAVILPDEGLVMYASKIMGEI